MTPKSIGPRFGLCRGRRTESALKPSDNHRMKDGRGVHETKSMWHIERQNSAPGREAKGRGRCKGSRAWDPRKDFFQPTLPPITSSTSNAI
jgi:hypothetical protein